MLFSRVRFSPCLLVPFVALIMWTEAKGIKRHTRSDGHIEDVNGRRQGTEKRRTRMYNIRDRQQPTCYVRKMRTKHGEQQQQQWQKIRRNIEDEKLLISSIYKRVDSLLSAALSNLPPRCFWQRILREHGQGNGGQNKMTWKKWHCFPRAQFTDIDCCAGPLSFSLSI